MISRSHFYHEHIKTAVAVFGSIFNDIVIKRKDGKVLPVPIAYGPRDKLLEGHKIHKASEEAIDRILPRMSYEMISMNYDAERKLTNKMVQIKTPDTAGITRQTAKVPVPYSLDFTLYIVTKNLNDGWQIMEQILPYFTPNYVVRVKSFPADGDPNTPLTDQYFDMPITLNSSSWADDYQGNIVEKRIVEWSLEFAVKINLYGQLDTSKLILDSRAVVAAVDQATTLGSIKRGDETTGTEVGYVNLKDSEQTPNFENDSDYSPAITNYIDSDGVLVKIVRSLPEDL